MAIWKLSTLLVTVFIVSTNADVYMQNPRGSNNRLNGRGRDRQNANRLFDSQNNARGGYNVGGLQYHAGSEMTIEWTNQHSCGGPNNNCELVIQYMCDDKLRNGREETTIRFPRFDGKRQGCYKHDCDNDHRYGMHENYDYYQHCFTRKRNYGLYTADQDMNGRNRAIHTRQERNGNRRGYECPEERDYYPYWHPTPWRDIAVLTNDVKRCDYYKKHSQNVADKYHCVLPGINSLPRTILKDLSRHFNNNPIPQTEEECNNYEREFDSGTPQKTVLKGKWEKVLSWGIGAPDCQPAPPSRDNHNGNGIGGHANTYNWTLPHDYLHESCALRIRYNISTGEFPWETYSDSNGRNKNNQPCKACSVNLGEQMGIDEWDAQDRDYILTGNPDILPLSINGAVQEKFELKLAIDTSQFGRTFEDRSHKFSIIKRPANIGKDAIIHNLSVRGKRGNIVQTYPATEYDFAPMILCVEQGEYIHMHWTGSDDNPQNNAGQGQAGTDRSNIVQLTKPQYYDVINAQADLGQKHGHWGNSFPAHVSTTSFLGLSFIDEQLLALGGAKPTGGDLDELDESHIHFDSLGTRQCNTLGYYRYLCTRNNNFTNRAQKALIIVKKKGECKRETKSDSKESFKSKKALNDDLEDIDKIEAEMRQDMMADR